MWIVIFLVYLLIYGFHIQNPPTPYHDEMYMVPTARQILHLSGYSNPHPPFGMLLIALSIVLFGDHSWVWRLNSLLAGFGCIFLTFLITRFITTSLLTAVLAAFFFAMDGLTIVLSRIATLNSVMLFFMLSSLYFLLLCMQQYKTRYVIFSALCLGLGVATRWVAAVTVIPLIFVFMQVCLQKHTAQCPVMRDFAFALAVCLAVYFSTFLIFPLLHGFNWRSILEFQGFNFHNLSTIPETSPSPFWQWPLLVKPMTFCQGEIGSFERTEGWRKLGVHLIMALGNPAVVWTGCLALIALLIRFIQKAHWGDGLILVCFFVFWMIPCAFMSRQQFSYYFYPAMPFLCMALGVVVKDMLESVLIKKILAYGYLALVVGMFVYWYPLWTDRPVSDAYFQNHMWFRSWPGPLR